MARIISSAVSQLMRPPAPRTEIGRSLICRTVHGISPEFRWRFLRHQRFLPGIRLLRRQVGEIVWMTPEEKFRGAGRMESPSWSPTAPRYQGPSYVRAMCRRSSVSAEGQSDLGLHPRANQRALNTADHARARPACPSATRPGHGLRVLGTGPFHNGTKKDDTFHQATCRKLDELEELRGISVLRAFLSAG